MEEYFIIQGGRSLEGEIEVRGAKNAAFPLLAAALLTKEACIIKNLPLIEDVFRMVEILKSMGADISWQGKRELKIDANQINPSNIDTDLVTKLRGSVLFLGPLLARFGKVRMPRPGGCLIGARPIDTHVDLFRQFGAEISFDGENYEFHLKERKGVGEVILQEFSVTATENAMLLAAAISGKTLIKAGDADYQVQELANFLRKMGARVEFSSDRSILVEGKDTLRGVEHELMYDPIEAGTFILTAAAARGSVLVRNVEVRFLDLFLKRLKDFGIPYEIEEQTENIGMVRVRPWSKIYIDRVQSLPYPGIHSDLLSGIGVLATQAGGASIIHDPLYEGRFKYLEELNRMGAHIIFCDPHRVVVNGPTPLRGRILKTVDIRGGAALIIAGLIAEGETIIQNAYQIDRGYEKIEERLRGIGADIQRVKS